MVKIARLLVQTLISRIHPPWEVFIWFKMNSVGEVVHQDEGEVVHLG